ncbi:hypothetical protein [Pseudonocardia zijingensis]|uniref:Uncharacterized protein n=1 Tax=Pseudonocardia zijingensis TaxID=153376 RepID=A0ABN1N8V6_9PSEU
MTTPAGCSAWADVDDIPTSAVGMHSPPEWCTYLELATDVLWALTGRRWRGQSLAAEVLLRPEPPRAGEAGGWPWHRSWGTCRCYGGPGLAGLLWRDPIGGHVEPTGIRLPHPDVTEVVAVTVDDVAFHAWRLDGSWLTRTDGCGWPTCRDRTLVTYLYGRTPPSAGRLACVELAVEFGRASASNPDRPCRLPQRVQSVTRQGLTFAALDDMEFLSEGLTGLYTVDLWIRSVNPYARPAAGSVWSPDLPRARRTTP